MSRGSNDGDVRLRFTAEDATRGAIDSASRNLGGLGAQAEAARARLDSVGTLMSRLASPAGAVAVLGASVAVVSSAILAQAEVLAQYKDAGDQMGDTAENVASLQHALDLSGTSVETMVAASIKLTAELSKQKDGSKGAGQALKALGLDFDEFKKLGPTEQLEAIAKAMAKFEDGAGKTAVAVALFGRSGAQLIPFLNDLAETGGRNVRITQEQIEKADELSKNWARMTSNARLLGQQISAGLIPSVNELVVAMGRVFAGAKDGGVPGLFGVDKETQRLAELGQNVRTLDAQLKRLKADRAGGIGFFGPPEKVDAEIARVTAGLERAKQLFREADAARKQPGAPGAVGVQAALRKLDFQYEDPDKDKPKGKSDAQREAERDAALLAKLSGVTTSYQEDLSRLSRLYSAGRLNVEQYREAVLALINDQPGARAAIQAEEKAQKDLNDTREKAAALSRRALDELGADADRRAAHNQSLRDEIEAIGLTSDQLAALALARMDAALAAEQENLIRAQGIEGNEAEVALIERRLELMRQERELTAQRIQRTEMAKLADEGRQRTKAIGDSIEQGVLNGFREGQGIADIFRRELEAQFARTVLRPQIDFVAKGLGQLFDMVMGGGGAGGLLGSIGGFIGDLLSFDGGGSTGNGPRLGGLDGKGGFLALMHPRETVVDHTRGQQLPGGAAPIQVSTTVHVAADGASRSQREGGNDEAGRALSAQLEQSVVAIIARESRQGGVLWKRGQGYA
jgi:hypothetical protein